VERERGFRRFSSFPPAHRRRPALANRDGIATPRTAELLVPCSRFVPSQAHPDRGGDPEKFKEVQHAYSILSDEEKRKLYDRFGEDGVEAGGRPGGGDPFEAMFGRRRRQGPPKSDPTVHQLAVKLEHLYEGKTVRMAVTRDLFDADAEGNVMTRDGTRYRRRQERKVLTVHIDKGMRNGQKIIFPGDGDVLPGHEPGDVVFVVKQQEHPTFHRKGGDLVMKKSISLFEALTGVDFVLEHLDGHKVRIKSTPGEVLSDETVKQVPDEGMPIFGHSSYMKGVLFVQFDIAMPKTLDLSEAQRRALGMLLDATAPGSAGASTAASAAAAAEGDEPMVETKVLEDADMEARKAREELANEAEGSDSDEGGGPGGQRVQCAGQ